MCGIENNSSVFYSRNSLLIENLPWEILKVMGRLRRNLLTIPHYYWVRRRWKLISVKNLQPLAAATETGE
jgi:hypothetical protein